ncbi:MAG TPA: hypothetical protein VIP70_08170 [Nitrososphaeraceae archaeon]
MQFDNIESVRSVLVDIVTYIKSLDVRNIDENTEKELLKIHSDWYKLIDVVDEKLQVPRIPVEGRVKIEKEK